MQNLPGQRYITMHCRSRCDLASRNGGEVNKTFGAAIPQEHEENPLCISKRHYRPRTAKRRVENSFV